MRQIFMSYCCSHIEELNGPRVRLPPLPHQTHMHGYNHHYRKLWWLDSKTAHETNNVNATNHLSRKITTTGVNIIKYRTVLPPMGSYNSQKKEKQTNNKFRISEHIFALTLVQFSFSVLFFSGLSKTMWMFMFRRRHFDTIRGTPNKTAWLWVPHET